MINFDLICNVCGYKIIDPKDSDYRIDEDGLLHFPYCPECNNIMSNIGFEGISKGDFKAFYSPELGASGTNQREYKKLHPDAEFNKYGALKIKNYRHLKRVLKEKGMQVLTDSSNYRDHCAEELEKARSMKREA